jgi:hypothetical protein
MTKVRFFFGFERWLSDRYRLHSQLNHDVNLKVEFSSSFVVYCTVLTDEKKLAHSRHVFRDTPMPLKNVTTSYEIFIGVAESCTAKRTGTKNLLRHVRHPTW